MATGIIEGATGEIVGAVVVKLGEMAVEQASLLLHFREDFVWLQSKLTYVRGYLQHSDGLSIKSELLKKWLSDVQNIALDAEDIVEECAVYRDSFVFRCKMGKRIRQLKERMESIMKNAVQIHLVQQMFPVSQPLTFHGGEEWKKPGLLERDARPVAMDAKVEQILRLLEDDAVQIIGVVGMGGIGKTFLLQNVYNHPQVRQRFEKAIWLSISQLYSVARLQCDIASHLDNDVKEDEVREQQAELIPRLRNKSSLVELIKDGGVSEPRATELIQERLRDKSCLFVMDDVWRLEGVNNLIGRLGIPCGTRNTCKVVVTTRSIDVCHIMGASQIYHMQLLSEEDSWNLFCLHAFPDDQQNRPSEELDEVAHQVARECCRLPLALKTVAASMASEKMLGIWESKLRQLKEVSHLQDPIEPILRLSYDALPAVLKPCFLYFSFFGEDVEIDAEYLIYLWIAEGFIPKGKEQWSIGWSYLKELNNLCLVEVSEESLELKRTCKIHDLLLDLIIHISKENKCAFKVEEASTVGCRRMLLAKKGLYDAAITGFKCPPSLRTLSMAENSIRELPTKSLKGVRAMRVMDLSSTYISVLPRLIGNFKLLRVLNLSKTRFRNGKVPYSVRNLKSLFFLNVDTCPVPKWIGDLKCLQHLHVCWVDYSREISMGISKLVSLRTFRTKSECYLVLKEVGKLIHLEEVSTLIAKEEELRSVEEGVLAQLVNMRRLTIETRYDRCTPLPEKMKAMKDLQYLLLIRFSVGRWICQYGNLRVLRLGRCELSEWAAVETMPNLIKLVLYMCRGCKELGESCGKSGAFPHLRYFRIQACDELEKLPELHDGAMPRVEEFVVSHCERLQKIPEGFEHLRSLKLLDLSDGNGFSDEERERLKEGGEYWNKIKSNNPHVAIRM